MKEKFLKIVFISWMHEHRRSLSISEQIGAKDIYIEYLKGRSIFLYPIRYLLQSLKTVAVLICEKPDAIIVMNPPIFAPLIVYLYSALYKKKYIIDSHTGAFSWVWGKFIPLHKYLSKKAIVTIITNDALKDRVNSWGAEAIILEDSLQNLVLNKEVEKFSRFSICVINSYQLDEPLKEILLAARDVPDCDFYVTGKITQANKEVIKAKPDNVFLTDYLPDNEYIELLNKVDAAMVLTTRDLTLLQGGFESVAAEKPLITSNWPVLKNYFSKGTLYVDNSPESISKAILEMRSKKAKLAEEIKILKKQMKADWDKKFNKFVACISESSNS